MAARKGQSAGERKQRFDTVLEVLSGNPLPLRVPGLVALLREAGYEIDDETPKKWRDRGIPERWARLIALLPRAKEVGLTADWIREGIGAPPRTRRPVEEGESHHGTTVRDSLRSKGAQHDSSVANKTAVHTWSDVAESIAARWRELVMARHIPFWDLIDLLRAEEDFLRKRAEGRGNDPALLAAAEETQQLRLRLVQMGQPR